MLEKIFNKLLNIYDEKASHIIDRFLENLYVEFDTITENPKLFQKKYRETRIRYLKKFPFGIHYIFKDKTVEVLAVLHTSRSPKNWNKR